MMEFFSSDSCMCSDAVSEMPGLTWEDQTDNNQLWLEMLHLERLWNT